MPLPSRRPRKMRRDSRSNNMRPEYAPQLVVDALRIHGYEMKPHAPPNINAVIEEVGFGPHALFKTSEGLFVKTSDGKTFAMERFKRFSGKEIGEIRFFDASEKYHGKAVLHTSMGTFVQLAENVFIKLEDLQKPLPIIKL